MWTSFLLSLVFVLPVALPGVGVPVVGPPGVLAPPQATNNRVAALHSSRMTTILLIIRVAPFLLSSLPGPRRVSRDLATTVELHLHFELARHEQPLEELPATHDLHAIAATGLV